MGQAPTRDKGGVPRSSKAQGKLPGISRATKLDPAPVGNLLSPVATHISLARTVPAEEAPEIRNCSVVGCMDIRVVDFGQDWWSNPRGDAKAHPKLGAKRPGPLPKLGAKRSASELGHKYNCRSSWLLWIILASLAYINPFKTLQNEGEKSRARFIKPKSHSRQRSLGNNGGCCGITCSGVPLRHRRHGAG